MTATAPAPRPPGIPRSQQTAPGVTPGDPRGRGFKQHTGCEDAKCPNRHECWNSGTATVMILGDICTRACRFCSVKTGRPNAVDLDEPRRVAEAAKGMKLKHIVVTSVDRDDLDDGGARVWADTIATLHRECPGIVVEVLTGDFEGDLKSLDLVLDAAPAIFSHNLETVSRLQPVIRPAANYGRSLAVLRHAAQRHPERPVKSGLMLGLGETEEEVQQALRDLYAVGCRIVTLGQYLRPTLRHIAVARFVEPAEFDRLAEFARSVGFLGVASGPLVRSSYKAEELYAAFLQAQLDTVLADEC